MSLHERFARVLDRLTAADGRNRIRGNDAERAERNGSSPERDARLEAAVSRLEAVADELEAATR